MRTLFATLIISSLILTSCRKISDYEWVEYQETSCYPGWVDPDSKRKTKQYLEGFLRGNNIVPVKIRVRGSRIDTCPYCDCSTGVVYRVKIHESDLGRAAYFGFH